MHPTKWMPENTAVPVFLLFWYAAHRGVLRTVWLREKERFSGRDFSLGFFFTGLGAGRHFLLAAVIYQLKTSEGCFSQMFTGKNSKLDSSEDIRKSNITPLISSA